MFILANSLEVSAHVGSVGFGTVAVRTSWQKVHSGAKLFIT
jgi:hypothetical protein